MCLFFWLRSNAAEVMHVYKHNENVKRKENEMKKILIGVLGCSLLACGCVKTDGKPDVSPAWTRIGSDSAFGITVCKVIKVEGHEYLVVRGDYAVSAVHAESCACRPR